MRIIALNRDRWQLYKLTRMLRKAAPEAEILGFRTQENALGYAMLKAVDVAFVCISPRCFVQNFVERLQELQPRINLVFIADKADSYYMSNAFKIYASGYIIKPYGLGEVEAELRNLRYTEDSG